MTEINSEEVTYSGKVFKVKKVNLSLPDGKRRNYDLIDIQNAVTILAIDQEQEVYFVEQFRVGAKRTLLELPAGKVEDGEDPLATARRELREEIRSDASQIRLLGSFFMTPGYASEYMYCYLATGLFNSPLEPDADEFLNLRKIPLTDVYEMIENGEIEDSKTLAAFMLAGRYLPH
ncbi:MAG: NUDIX hydrolase [Chloroflexi bacterium]|nr:NUDIX hydrolase [Chloroflexota bacterium]